MSEKHEIVVVRRRHGGDHDGHHGGAWKIAFADFMTAMMAFFLVLWIVNSTSKETRSSIARYFNPIKLSDTTPARKGLQDPREEDFEATEQTEKKPKTETQAAKGSGPAPMIGTPSKATSAAPVQGGPASERQAEAGGEGAQAAHDNAAKPLPPETVNDPFKLLRPRIVQQTSFDERQKAAVPQEKALAEPRPNAVGGDAQTALRASAQPAARVPTPSNVDQPLQQAVEALSRKENTISGSNAVSITEVPEGTLISLLDDSDVAMFAPGSFKLSTGATATLVKIGKAIGSIPNSIIIAGYTDATAYRKGQGDNFKLSALRAEAAMSVLIQTGLPEQRIERIEGHADRQPLAAQDRANGKNRRIDILLRRKDG